MVCSGGDSAAGGGRWCGLINKAAVVCGKKKCIEVKIVVAIA